jgi:hypothetical protein
MLQSACTCLENIPYTIKRKMWMQIFGIVCRKYVITHQAHFRLIVKYGL